MGCSRWFLVLLPAALAWSQTTSADSTVSSSNEPSPIRAKERIRWVVESTIGPPSLVAGLLSAGLGTWDDIPEEYGTHWEGFGTRYGMRLTGIATSHVMEAGLGAIWGEDPRYVRDPGAPFGSRIGHALKMTFLARDRDGRTMPAYARFIAIPSTNFLSNTWRADSEATTKRATIRIGLGFLGRAASNTFDEFWPDVRQKFFSHESSSQPLQRTVGN